MIGDGSRPCGSVAIAHRYFCVSLVNLTRDYVNGDSSIPANGYKADNAKRYGAKYGYQQLHSPTLMSSALAFGQRRMRRLISHVVALAE